MSRDFKRVNFSITNRVDSVLDEKADEWDMSRSEIVREAVLEYTDEDRTARIEHKLDRVLDAVADGAPHTSSEPDLEKERHSNEDSAPSNDLPADLLPTDTPSPTENRANEMFNTLIRDRAEEGADVVTEREIHESIVDVWGEDTDYMLKNYTEKIEARFEDAGFRQHVSKPHLWYLTDAAYEGHLRGRWEDVEDAILDGDPAAEWEVREGLPAVQRALSEGRELKQAVLNAGVESEQRVEDLFEQAQLKLDPDTESQSAGEEPAESSEDSVDESVEEDELAFSILTVVEDADGEVAQSELEEELGMPFHEIFDAASELKEQGRLDVRSGEDKSRIWSLPDS